MVRRMMMSKKNWMTMKIIKEVLEKSEISDLPRVVFQGRIVCIQAEAEADKAIEYLLMQQRVGVDTETRPSFVSGKTYKVALVQISTLDVCFLFRLNYIGFPESLKRFLEDKKVEKIGLSLKDDFGALRRRGDFMPGKFVELQSYVHSFGIKDQSLQKIYANLFGQKISKSQRLTNWEAEILNDGQKLYAATDAWACLMIYNYLEQLKETGDYMIERTLVDKIEAESHK